MNSEFADGHWQMAIRSCSVMYLRCHENAVQVRIMKGADDAGKGGPKKPMPDVVEIIPPKDDDYVGEKNLIGKDKEGYSVTKEIEPVQLQPQAGLAGGGQP